MSNLIKPLALFVMFCSNVCLGQENSDSYIILKQDTGDLNADHINDLAIVAYSKLFNDTIVTIFINDINGEVKKVFENNKLTEAFMIMYNEVPEIEITKGTLILHYYGGMCHRESRRLIFLFDKNQNDLFFDKIEWGSHNVCNDSKPENEIYTSEEEKQIRFCEYVDEN